MLFRSKMKVLNPFGPVLAKVRIPKKIVNKINLEVDKIILNKKLSKKNDYSKKVVGQVHQEIRLSDQFTSKVIKKFLLKNISSYIKKSINQNTNKISSYVLKDTILEKMIQKKGELKLNDIKRQIIKTDHNSKVPILFDKLLRDREHLSLVIDKQKKIKGIVNNNTYFTIIIAMSRQ